MNQPAIRVLIVDDEAAIRRALRPPLAELGFQITEASRGEEALQLLHANPVDVVLLDINMPGIGGIETLRRIRAFAPRLPVLMVTVRDGEEEKVEALELGADDYVTKPFSIKELLARAAAFLRRARKEVQDVYEFGGFRLDTSARRFTRKGKEIELSPKEFNLLEYFVKKPGRALTRDEILNAVWGYDCVVTSRSIDRFVTTLREKIEPDPSRPIFIHTIRQIGYRFEPPEQK